jgi:hypothetical protein
LSALGLGAILSNELVLSVRNDLSGASYQKKKLLATFFMERSKKRKEISLGLFAA